MKTIIIYFTLLENACKTIWVPAISSQSSATNWFHYTDEQGEYLGSSSEVVHNKSEESNTNKASVVNYIQNVRADIAVPPKLLILC